MSRLPFDPTDAAGPAPPAPSSAPLSVAQLTAMVARALQTALPPRITVVGEISNFNQRTHWYFRLKDDDAIIDCVMFAQAARAAGFAPADGHRVILKGRVEFYPKQGRTQFYATSIEPVGQGDLELRLRALIAELRGLGWLDDARKRPLPVFPRRVAVITSRTGAALQDVLTTMAARCPAVDVLLVDVRVQGDAAAPQIASAIDHLSSRAGALGIDAILLTRGGGSIEDLWTFNERAVAGAIVRCSVPVVAAIGHETDVTIAELVADHRASTPTQAAMRLTPDRAALAEQTDQSALRLGAALSRRLERANDRLGAAARRLDHAAHRAVAGRLLRIERLGSRLALVRPQALYAARREAVLDLTHRLNRAVRQRVTTAGSDLATLRTDLARAWSLSLERRRARLDALERELAVTGPRAVLARGYSVTTLQDGRVVRSTSQAQPGEILTTRVADGSFISTITSDTPAWPELTATPTSEPPSEPAVPLSAVPPRRPATPALPPRTRKTSAKPADPNQMGLF